MFHLLKNLKPTYTWPVTAAVAIDGGDVARIEFDAEFNRLPASRVLELLDQSNDARPKTDQDLLAEVLVSIKATDENGRYGEITADACRELRAVQGVDRAIATYYFESLTGEKTKNLRMPPAAGRHVPAAR